MDYLIYLNGDLSIDALRTVLHRRFRLDPRGVELEGHFLRDERAVVLLTRREDSGDFEWELAAGQVFADLTGLDELGFARILTADFRNWALIDDGGDQPSRWLLVTPEGSGLVIIDEDDEGRFTIDHALAPIPGAPDLRVQPPVDWS